MSTIGTVTVILLVRSYCPSRSVPVNNYNVFVMNICFFKPASALFVNKIDANFFQGFRFAVGTEYKIMLWPLRLLQLQ